MCVLIVDDDRTNLEIMAGVARLAGSAEAVCFADPVEALDWVDTRTPDLILLDHMMPGMDGLEFLRRVRAVRRLDDVPVVMVTANDMSELRLKALQEGATDFLNKPMRVPELRARVRNLLALRNTQRLLRDRAAHLAHEVAAATREIREREIELIIRMSRAAEFRDPETGAHIERMARYSRLIAEQIGLPEEMCQALFVAAPMHDVGKLGIPDAILLKPGRLNPDELAVMRRHAEIGFAILKDSKSDLVRLGAEIALTHHEKWDGSGYPRGLAGEAIPLTGRIVAVADVFDALTTARPYKRPWPLAEARAYLAENADRHFDRRCVEAFFARWDAVLEIHRTVVDPDLPADPADG